MTKKQKAQRLQALKDAHKRLKKDEVDESEFKDEHDFEETKVEEMNDEIGEDYGY